jgi:hypothetical protein
VFALAAVEIFEDFIRDLQPLEMNDADVFVAMFPNLALLEFERHEIEGTRLSGFCARRDGRGRNYFFLPAACLLAAAAFFLAAMLLALEFFWPDFF